MKKVLMCPPQYFGVFYKINPWMNPSNKVDVSRAIEQWNELLVVYKDLGIQVEQITPIDGLPDMVFAANGFFAIGARAVLSRFRYKERQSETNYFSNWLEQNSFDVVDPGKIVYEGEGDTFLVQDTIYQGWGFRSDPTIASIFKTAFQDKAVKLLHLIDDKFYHFDTCFFPVDQNLVYFYENAFDSDSSKTIRSSFKKAVAVTREEAMTFSLNSIQYNNTIIMNSHSKKFAERIRSEGFTVISVDVSEFMKSGGSVKCLTNELYK